jgi:hypothetical protein
MNNIIMRKIVLTGSYQQLSSVPLVASVCISCPPDNTGIATFKGDDGSDVPWQSGEWHKFVRVNLTDIQAKGTAGDILTIVGGTW